MRHLKGRDPIDQPGLDLFKNPSGPVSGEVVGRDPTYQVVVGLDHVAADWRAGGVRTSEKCGGADLIGPPPRKGREDTAELDQIQSSKGRMIVSTGSP